MSNRLIHCVVLAALPLISAACKSTRGPERPEGISESASGRAEAPVVVMPVDGAPAPPPETTAPQAAAQAPPRQDSRSISPEVLALIPENSKITIALPEGNASEFARMIARSCDLNIIVPDQLDRRGALELKNVSARDAFAALTQRFDLRLERQGTVLMLSDARVPRRMSKLLHTQVSDLGNLEEKLKPILGDDGSFTISEQARTIFVDAAEDRVAKVEALLAALALEERQVVIEARIYEVSFEDRLEFGIKHDHVYDVGDSTLGILQNLLPDSHNFGVTAANRPGTITSTLEALRRLGSVELLSSPRVATLNGNDASISVLQEVPYVQTTNTVAQTNAGGSSSTFQQVEFKEAGITLKVKPTVLSDGSVRLDVNTQVSQVTNYFQNIPVIDKRTLQSIVFLADGGTIFLGGLMQRFVSDVERKVPILGDIPLIGLLFKSLDQEVKRKELLVLLTTRVMKGSHDSSITNEFKGLYRAERSAIESKRDGTRLSDQDVPEVK